MSLTYLLCAKELIIVDACVHGATGENRGQQQQNRRFEIHNDKIQEENR
ncbi:hypothetical protein VCC_000590 [Vibrio cholerae RC9]|nr:hypothetical protein VCD_000774 [Vibrio cholerae MJ-1236]EEO11425.1 hypothetical protein VCC_000590 [Vibrio cholerae RC9]EEO18492.1 hypothetical protein VCE_001005 [Vibrio cholerae B33]